MFIPTLLEQQTILITGGATGLGFVMAKKFLSLGSSVVICGRNEEKLRNAEKELSSLGKVYSVPCDIREYSSVEKMFSQITSSFGEVTCLVNNAAGNFLAASEDLSPNGFRSIVDIVLCGTFNCTQHFGKHRIEQGKSGAVLNVVTTYTHSGSAFVLPSACAKAGVYALTTSLAYEWATYKIRLNAIAPGPFPTEGAWSRLIPDKSFEDILRKKIPLGRFGDPEELANLGAFLLSDMASFITGECVTIDGGEHLNAGEFNVINELVPRDQLKLLFNSLRRQKDI